jgi:hypothetical protein
MDRRELLKMIAVLTGGVVVGSEVFLSGCKPKDTQATGGRKLTEADVPFLDEVAETILPATKTPGAKLAKVGSFMVVIVNDCYEERDQKIFSEGIGKLDEACKKMHSHGFMKATPQQRTELLVGIDKEAKKHQDTRGDWDKDQEIKEKEQIDKGNTKFKKEPFPTHYFTLMKQLTLWGYFTSKEGVTQAMRYTPVPGKYEGCIPYTKGEAAFAGLDG